MRPLNGRRLRRSNSAPVECRCPPSVVPSRSTPGRGDRSRIRLNSRNPASSCSAAGSHPYRKQKTAVKSLLRDAQNRCRSAIDQHLFPGNAGISTESSLPIGIPEHYSKRLSCFLSLTWQKEAAERRLHPESGKIISRHNAGRKLTRFAVDSKTGDVEPVSE